MEGLGALSAMLECIIIAVERSIRDIFNDFRISVWSCYGNFHMSFESIRTLGLIFKCLMRVLGLSGSFSDVL